MAWANVRQLLGHSTCAQALTDGDFQTALSYARSADPTNLRTAYGGALVYSWAGKRPEALALLSEVVRHSLNLSESQRRVIFSILRSSSDVLSVITPRFPQARAWAELYSGYDL